MVGEWIPLNFWLRELKNTLFDPSMDQSVKRQAFCDRMLYIAMQTVEMRVPLLFLRGFPRHMVRLEDSICDPFVLKHF